MTEGRVQTPLYDRIGHVIGEGMVTRKSVYEIAMEVLDALGLSPTDTWTCARCGAVRYSSALYGDHLLACPLYSEGARRG